MKILIRQEGAARNLNALKELYKTNAEDVMLCSDDLKPEMLIRGHINILIPKLSSKVATEYEILSVLVKDPECKMSVPFIPLLFMALLVITELKLSNKGLFNENYFNPIPLFVA